MYIYVSFNTNHFYFIWSIHLIAPLYSNKKSQIFKILMFLSYSVSSFGNLCYLVLGLPETFLGRSYFVSYYCCFFLQTLKLSGQKLCDSCSNQLLSHWPGRQTFRSQGPHVFTVTEVPCFHRKPCNCFNSETVEDSWLIVMRKIFNSFDCIAFVKEESVISFNV